MAIGNPIGPFKTMEEAKAFVAKDKEKNNLVVYKDDSGRFYAQDREQAKMFHGHQFGNKSFQNGRQRATQEIRNKFLGVVFQNDFGQRKDQDYREAAKDILTGKKTKSQVIAEFAGKGFTDPESELKKWGIK